jgi:AcrR family transcriptional regulator
MRSIIFPKVGQIWKSVTTRLKGVIMAGKTKVHEEQIEQTRSYIFEALLLLMDKKPYGKISVADIAKKAGVARQTFYRHYKTKDDVILQFLEDCFGPPVMKFKNIPQENKHDAFKISLPLKQIIRHAETIKRILTSDAEYLIIMSIQKWKDYIINSYAGKLSMEENIYFRYRTLFSTVGFTEIICDWIKNDMPISEDKLKILFTKENSPYFQSDSNIPDVVLHIKD